MFDDTYKTLKTFSKGIYTEKGSKFIALAFPVSHEEEIKSHIAETKKSYYDARHHCYAYILGADKSAYRVNDDRFYLLLIQQIHHFIKVVGKNGKTIGLDLHFSV